MELDLKARTMISSGADDALEGKSWQGGPDTGPPRQRGWKGTGVWTRGRAEKRRRRNILGWTRGTLVTNVEKGPRDGEDSQGRRGSWLGSQLPRQLRDTGREAVGLAALRLSGHIAPAPVPGSARRRKRLDAAGRELRGGPDPLAPLLLAATPSTVSTIKTPECIGVFGDL